jgi:O-antigen/teichoic acid export membrane protein
MSGRSKLNLINISFILVTNILLNLFFIPKYGVSGAALATTISISLGGVIALLEVNAILKIHPYRLDFFKPLMAGCMSFGVLFVLEGHIGQKNYPIILIALILIFILLYAYILFLFGISAEDRFILDRLKSKLVAH